MERAKKNITPEDSNRDLPDSPHDIERMQSEETTLDLPDVKDIPGQEHIHVPPLGELADTTISSDDEEGKGIWDDADDEERHQRHPDQRREHQQKPLQEVFPHGVGSARPRPPGGGRGPIPCVTPSARPYPVAD